MTSDPIHSGLQWAGPRHDNPRGQRCVVFVQLTKKSIADVLKDPAMHPLEKLAALTVGYAGSDLKDVVSHGMPEIYGTGKVTVETLLSGLTKVGTLHAVQCQWARQRMSWTWLLPCHVDCCNSFTR